MNRKNIGVIVGAGKGKRMGLRDKAFMLLNKKPCFIYSALVFERSDLIDEIICVVQKEKIQQAEKVLKKFRISKVTRIIAGGKERQDSVCGAIRDINDNDFVLVHDAARPLISVDLINKCVNSVHKFKAVIAGMPARDTIKKGGAFIKETLPRSQIFLAQTPQAFRADILKEAYEAAYAEKYYGTDDASLVERLGYKVRIIKGDCRNTKITEPGDLKIIEYLLK